VLFRATENIWGGKTQIDPDPGWARNLGANLTVTLTPGDHYTLLKDSGHIGFVSSQIVHQIGA
jgi:hypothetical protein